MEATNLVISQFHHILRRFLTLQDSFADTLRPSGKLSNKMIINYRSTQRAQTSAESQFFPDPDRDLERTPRSG